MLAPGYGGSMTAAQLEQLRVRVNNYLTASSE
jgi:hypothetical protein